MEKKLNAEKNNSVSQNLPKSIVDSNQFLGIYHSRFLLNVRKFKISIALPTTEGVGLRTFGMKHHVNVNVTR